MTSGPFFAVIFLIKYTIKFGVLYFIYNKQKNSISVKNDAAVISPMQTNR